MEEFFDYEPEEGYTAEQHQQCAAAISKVYAYFGETCAGSLVSGGVIQTTVSATSPGQSCAGSSDMEIYVLRETASKVPQSVGQLHFDGMDRKRPLHTTVQSAHYW